MLKEQFKENFYFFILVKRQTPERKIKIFKRIGTHPSRHIIKKNNSIEISRENFHSLLHSSLDTSKPGTKTYRRILKLEK